MKSPAVRAVTCGVSLHQSDDAAAIRCKIASALRLARGIERSLVAAGWVVQTVRVVSNSFEDFVPTVRRGAM